jgi:hypothetical protein
MSIYHVGFPSEGEQMSDSADGRTYVVTGTALRFRSHFGSKLETLESLF